MFVIISDLCVHTKFDVVMNLAIDVLIVTSCINQSIRSIFSNERQALSWHSTRFSILLCFADGKLFALGYLRPKGRIGTYC